MDLLNLPEDAVTCVLLHLDYQDVLRVAATCRSLRRVASSECLWMSFCSRWGKVLNLEEWRAGVISGMALFRLLNSFDKLVGTWTAKELSPRGGLLYVTWGSLSLVACRLLTTPTGESRLRRLFEVVGSQDGSAKVELYATFFSKLSNEIHVPGGLVWCSRTEPEFYLELTGWSEAPESSNREEEANNRSVYEMLALLASASRGMPLQMEVGRQQAILLRGIATFGFIYDNEDYLGLEDSQHLPLRYLLCLAFSEHNSRTENTTARRGLMARSLYQRLKVEEPVCGKQLVGLWSGVYGPHGVEIINVSYTDQEIVGTKVLGDPNVPCGQVTFKAKFSTESAQVPTELQRLVDLHVSYEYEPFTVIKTFRGYGRIAEHNFVNPQWVPGQLLINQNRDIAFLWEDENFIIPFYKLNLSTFYESQKLEKQISE